MTITIILIALIVYFIASTIIYSNNSAYWKYKSVKWQRLYDEQKENNNELAELKRTMLNMNGLLASISKKTQVIIQSNFDLFAHYEKTCGDLYSKLHCHTNEWSALIIEQIAKEADRTTAVICSNIDRTTVDNLICLSDGSVVRREIKEPYDLEKDGHAEERNWRDFTSVKVGDELIFVEDGRKAKIAFVARLYIEIEDIPAFDTQGVCTFWYRRENGETYGKEYGKAYFPDDPDCPKVEA